MSFGVAIIALSIILLPIVFGERCWTNCSRAALVLDCAVISDAAAAAFSHTLTIGTQSNATATLTVRVAPLLWINITTFPTTATDTAYNSLYDFSVELRDCAAATSNMSVVMGNVVRVALVVRNTSLQQVLVQGNSTYSGVYLAGSDIAPTTYHSRTANLSSGIAVVGGTHYGLELLLTNITLRYPLVGRFNIKRFDDSLLELLLIANSQLRTSAVGKAALSIAFIGVTVAHRTRLLLLLSVTYYGLARSNHTGSANGSNAFVPQEGLSVVMKSVTQVFEGNGMSEVNATNANVLQLSYIALLAFFSVMAASDTYNASTSVVDIDVSNVYFYLLRSIVAVEGCNLAAFRLVAQHTVCEAHCSLIGMSESNLTGPAAVILRDCVMNLTAVRPTIDALGVVALRNAEVHNSFCVMFVRLTMLAHIAAGFSISSFASIGVGGVVFRGGALDVWIVNSTLRQEFLSPPSSLLGLVTSTAAVAVTDVTFERDATKGIDGDPLSFISGSAQNLRQDAEYARSEISRALVQTRLQSSSSGSSGELLGNPSVPPVAQVAVVRSAITCSATAAAAGVVLSVSLVAGNTSRNVELLAQQNTTRNVVMVVVTDSAVRTTAVASSAAVSVTIERPPPHEASCPLGASASASDAVAAYAVAMWGSTFVTTITAPPLLAWSTYANTLIVKDGGAAPSLCSAGISIVIRFMRCSATVVRPVLWTGWANDRSDAFINSRAYLSAHILVRGVTNCELDLLIEGEQFRLQNATLFSTVALWAIVGTDGSRVRVHDTYCPRATLHIVNASFSMFFVNGSTFDVIEVVAPGYFRNSILHVGAERDGDVSNHNTSASVVNTISSFLVGRISVGSDYLGSSVAVCNATVLVAHMNMSGNSVLYLTFVTLQKLTVSDADSAGGLCILEVSARNLVMGPLQSIVVLSDCELRGFGNLSVIVEDVEYADFAAAPFPLTILNAATWVRNDSYVLCVTRGVVASVRTTLLVRRVRVMRAGFLLRIHSSNLTNFGFVEPAAVLLQVTDSTCRQHCELLSSVSVGFHTVKAVAIVQRCEANMSATTILTPLFVSSITAAREASVLLSDSLVSFTGQGDVALRVEECTLRYRAPSGFAYAGVAVIGLGMFGIRESQTEIVRSSIQTVVEPGAFVLANGALGVAFPSGGTRVAIVNSSLAADGGLTVSAVGIHAPVVQLAILDSFLSATAAEHIFFLDETSAAAVFLGQRLAPTSLCAATTVSVAVSNTSLESSVRLASSPGFAIGISIADYCNVSLSVHVNNSTSNSLLLMPTAGAAAQLETAAVFLSVSECRVQALDVLVTHSVLVSRAAVQNASACRTGCALALSTNVLMRNVSFSSDPQHPQRPTAVIAIRHTSLSSSVFILGTSGLDAALSLVSNIAFVESASTNHTTAHLVVEVLNSTLMIHDNITTGERNGMQATHVYVDPFGIGGWVTVHVAECNISAAGHAVSILFVAPWALLRWSHNDTSRTSDVLPSAATAESGVSLVLGSTSALSSSFTVAMIAGELGNVSVSVILLAATAPDLRNVSQPCIIRIYGYVGHVAVLQLAATTLEETEYFVANGSNPSVLSGLTVDDVVLLASNECGRKAPRINADVRRAMRQQPQFQVHVGDGAVVHAGLFAACSADDTAPLLVVQLFVPLLHVDRHGQLRNTRLWITDVRLSAAGRDVGSEASATSSSLLAFVDSSSASALTNSPVPERFVQTRNFTAHINNSVFEVFSQRTALILDVPHWAAVDGFALLLYNTSLLANSAALMCETNATSVSSPSLIRIRGAVSKLELKVVLSALVGIAQVVDVTDHGVLHNGSVNFVGTFVYQSTSTCGESGGGLLRLTNGSVAQGITILVDAEFGAAQSLHLPYTACLEGVRFALTADNNTSAQWNPAAACASGSDMFLVSSAVMVVDSTCVGLSVAIRNSSVRIAAGTVNAANLLGSQLARSTQRTYLDRSWRSRHGGLAVAL